MESVDKSACEDLTAAATVIAYPTPRRILPMETVDLSRSNFTHSPTSPFRRPVNAVNPTPTITAAVPQERAEQRDDVESDADASASSTTAVVGGPTDGSAKSRRSRYKKQRRKDRRNKSKRRQESMENNEKRAIDKTKDASVVADVVSEDKANKAMEDKADDEDDEQFSSMYSKEKPNKDKDGKTGDENNMEEEFSAMYEVD
jgi:hypothetical protein